MEIKVIEKTIYVASDKKEFESESACKEHERYIALNEERYPRLSRKLTSLIQTVEGFEDFKVEIGKQKFNLFKNGNRVYEIYDLIKMSDFREKFLDPAYIKYGYIPEGSVIWCMFSTR